MAKLTELDLTTLPTGGFRTSSPSVSIGENGQLRISSAASKVLGNAKLVKLSWDAESRTLAIQTATAESKGTVKVVYHKNSGNGATISKSSLWGQLGYDYKNSGNQIFTDLKMSEKQQAITFVVPKGTLPMREKKQRVKKAAKAPSNPTVAPAVAAAASAPALEDLEIQ